MIRWSGGAPPVWIAGKIAAKSVLKTVATIATTIAVTIVALGVLIRPNAALAQTGEYGALFEALKAGLYTVEVVDRASGNKNAQGSGFVVDASGVLATNYHVVSEYVLDPDRYSLRYRDVEGETGPLDVLALDVLHDLALVRFDEPDPDRRERAVVFDLADDSPRNGATLLALGNPYDIGLSLVPGTYNGMLENQYRKLIHFTGALNPGMSGGPAVDVRGKVVGINVAGAGNSVSFLVPVSNLARLIERAPSEPRPLEELRDGLAQVLIDHQGAMIEDLLDGDWTPEDFGPLMIPRSVRPWISCSGSSNEADAETPWRSSQSSCTLNDRIYLSRSLDTGPVEIIFGWWDSDRLNAFQFSRIVQTGSSFVPFNRTSDDDVTEFECQEQWTEIEALEPVPFKASYCLRTYLDYPGLYDVLYVARAQRDGPEAVFLHYTLAGVGRMHAMDFHRKFIGSVRWK